MYRFTIRDLLWLTLLVLLATVVWKSSGDAGELQPTPESAGIDDQELTRRAVSYDEHQDLGYYHGQGRVRHEVRSAEDWQIRRKHILDNLQLVMGRLPGEPQRVPLDVRVGEESRSCQIALFARTRVFSRCHFERG